MVTFRQRRILSIDLFHYSPDLVDTLTAQMDQALLLKAWNEGWLPGNTVWSFWMERPEHGWEYLPMAEVSMTVTKRRDGFGCGEECCG